eukprot:11866253-Karenia_brevis.AAC.1
MTPCTAGGFLRWLSLKGPSLVGMSSESICPRSTSPSLSWLGSSPPCGSLPGWSPPDPGWSGAPPPDDDP